MPRVRDTVCVDLVGSAVAWLSELCLTTCGRQCCWVTVRGRQCCWVTVRGRQCCQVCSHLRPCTLTALWVKGLPLVHLVNRSHLERQS